MTQFMGSHANRLDAKGRVSIPAPFRNLLKDGDGDTVLVLRASHNHPCIEVWPVAAFEALAAQLRKLDTFGTIQDDLATALYSDTFRMEPDKEGRLVLPEFLKEHAGLTEGVTFMGHGFTFEIWEPAAGARRRAEARARAQERGLTLPGSAA